MTYVDARSAVAAADAAAVSLAELTRRFRPALKAYFLKRAPAGIDADDLVRDVFVRLAGRNRIAGTRQAEGYLFQAAADVLTDRVRYCIARRRDWPEIRELADRARSLPRRRRLPWSGTSAALLAAFALAAAGTWRVLHARSRTAREDLST